MNALQPWHLLIVLLVLVMTVVAVSIVVLTARTKKQGRATPTPPGAASPSQTAGLAPGWYPDQIDPKVQRYFDGRTWTSGTAPRE